MSDDIASDWLTRKMAAAFLTSIGAPLAPQTLAKLAANNNGGNGPPFTRTRWKIVRYRKADLRQWAEANSRRYT